MKSRLFWKILFGFWLTLGLITAGIILSFTARHPVHMPPPPAPWTPIALLLVAGFVFSAVLAANLDRPIRRLRSGFRSLASGDLGVRLRLQTGNRRDELTDLAQDFNIMAERLQHLVVSRDQLLHDVSHELRSPLARLSVAVALARQNPSLGEAALLRVEAEGARLNAIVGDLLSLARVEDRASLDLVYIDIAAMLEVICGDARFEGQPRGVTIEIAVSPELQNPASDLLVPGDPELLRRAVENVVRNALRFSPPRASILVAANAKLGTVTIDVSDDGPGATENLRFAMFEPFVKGANSAGVGLGLAIADRAVRAHKGTIEAFAGDRGGLTVRLRLPTVSTA